MLLPRVITGIIGGAFLLYSLYTGSWLYLVLVLLLAVLGWKEYSKALQGVDGNVPILLGAALLLFTLFFLWLEFYTLAFVLMMIVPLLSLLAVIFTFPKRTIHDGLYMIGGFYYLAMGFGSLLMLRHVAVLEMIEHGLGITPLHISFFALFSFLCTWASDTFAYFTGKAMGRRKLCPQISPGKTVEGCLGGAIGTIVVALVVAYMFNFSLLHGAILGLLIAIVAPLGDLAESLLKRACNIKDSGSLLPGHGGVLDRFDSILFVAPVVLGYLILWSR